jgi:hypothetical protein
MFLALGGGIAGRRVFRVQHDCKLSRVSDHCPCAILSIRLRSCTSPPSQADISNLLKDYDIKENIDTLHQVVLEAQERKARGETRQDVWKEGLQPKDAIRARIYPVLEAEAERLREMLKKVWELLLPYVIPSSAPRAVDGGRKYPASGKVGR